MPLYNIQYNKRNPLQAYGHQAIILKLLSKTLSPSHTPKSNPKPCVQLHLVSSLQDGFVSHLSQISFFSCKTNSSKLLLCHLQQHHQFLSTTSSSSMMMIPTTTALHFSLISTIDKVAKKSNIDDLLQDLDYQIKCYTKYTKPNFPVRFPFEVIQDDPKKKTITLTRKYEDEVIKVEVHAPYKVTIKGEETSDSEDDREEEQERIPLVVSVSKGNGTVLEFGCTFYFGELSLDSIIVRKEGAPEDDIACEGPELHRLPVYLHKVFFKYLEIRGIDPNNPNNNTKYYESSNTDYLSTMMEAKINRNCLAWLKNVKQFFEE